MERIVEGPLAVYQRHLNNGVLAYQYSAAADRAVFYPRVVCPWTGTALEWRESRGVGTVHAITWYYPKDAAAYNVVLVDLDEGFRMMSQVEPSATVAADQVKIGMRVRLKMRVKEGADNVPVFELTGE